MTRGGEKGISARVVLAAALALLAVPGSASAATITPTIANDEFMGGGLGCSVREAVQSINMGSNQLDCVATGPNAYGTNDLIRLNNVPFVLTRPGSGEDNNQDGDLDITSTDGLNIDSTSGNPSVSQAITDRVLDIHPGVTMGLNNLTIEDGQAATAVAPGNQGGNVLFRGGNSDILQLVNVDLLDGLANNGGGRGGGIASISGGVVLIQGTSLIQDNVAGGGGAGFGGGIYMTGTGGSLTVSNSSINSNDANFNSGGATQGSGGGVFFGVDNATTIDCPFPTQANVCLTNATIDQNRAAGGTGTGFGNGGGIAVAPGAGPSTLIATGGSISNNEAGGGTGHVAEFDSVGYGGGLDFAAGGGTSSANLDDVDVVGNKAGGLGEKANGNGGGILTDSDLTIDDSQVSSNRAGSDPTVTPKAPGLNGSGGGIQTTFNADADLTVTDSSINTNAAGDNLGFGGGIDMESMGNLSITDSTISGNAAGSSGAEGGAQGGGINRFATMGNPTDTITRTAITANTTTGKGGQPEGTPQGAGISAVRQGSLTIDSSTVANNTATGVNGNPNGGGLYLDSNTTGPAATYNLINSTISGNTATSAANEGANGGGIAVAGAPSVNPPIVTLTHVTVAGNTTGTDTQVPIDSGLGGNLYLGVESGLNLFDLRATVIAGGTAGAAGTGNCGLAVMGAIESLGENVEQTTPSQCELDGIGDQVGVNPMLDLLNPLNGGDPKNGVPPATRALMIGSPAINSVPSGGLCPGTDQRGLARPQGPACDAGAYEAPDADADGLIDSADSCPAQAGPASNNGCPLPVVNPPLTTPPTSTPAAPTRKKCKKRKKGAAAAKKCKKRKKA